MPAKASVDNTVARTRMAAITYRQAGVDVHGADRLLARLGPVIRSTHGPEVLPDRGQFAGLFRLSTRGLHEPILVSSTDGVGTKLKVAQLIGRHAGIGVDVVAMNTNDVLAYGARPLFFLDYVAMGKLDAALIRQLVHGIAQGCRDSGCALIGGETAEMPGVYADGEYDVAGFCVGLVDRRAIVDGSQVRAGDCVVGLASDGVHANGFSLVRRVFGPSELKRHAAALLRPTRIYVKPVLAALRRVRLNAIAHITGGGLSRRLANLVAKRPGLVVHWMPEYWPVPAIFSRIQRAGMLSDDEMYNTFNMGIGMALVCRPAAAQALITLMARYGLRAWRLGHVAPGR